MLLFEFSARSFIPVALACITGAAGHHLLFEEGVVFPLSFQLQPSSNYALLFYATMGIVIGLISVIVTKVVYWIEDVFEKLPIHWAWWPAIGGIAVGVVGFFHHAHLVLDTVILQTFLQAQCQCKLCSLCVF